MIKKKSIFFQIYKKGKKKLFLSKQFLILTVILYLTYFSLKVEFLTFNI